MFLCSVPEKRIWIFQFHRTSHQQNTFQNAEENSSLSKNLNLYWVFLPFGYSFLELLHLDYTFPSDLKKRMFYYTSTSKLRFLLKKLNCVFFSLILLMEKQHPKQHFYSVKKIACISFYICYFWTFYTRYHIKNSSNDI